jgi:uncharacterized protein YggE
MRSIVLTGTVFLLFAACGDVGNQNGVGTYPPSISVTGVGTATGVADMAVISFSIDVTNSDAETAVDEAAGLAENAIDAAVEAGVSETDVETTGYNLYMEEEYDYNTCEYTGSNTFHLTHSFNAKVRDINQAGDVLAALVNGGATFVNGINFTISNRDELLAEARELAIADARKTAEQLAEGLGVSLGDPVNVSEWVDYYSGYDDYGMDGEYYCDAPPVSPGNSSITLNVSISFEIR